MNRSAKGRPDLGRGGGRSKGRRRPRPETSARQTGCRQDRHGGYTRTKIVQTPNERNRWGQTSREGSRCRHRGKERRDLGRKAPASWRTPLSRSAQNRARLGCGAHRSLAARYRGLICAIAFVSQGRTRSDRQCAVRTRAFNPIVVGAVLRSAKQRVSGSCVGDAGPDLKQRRTAGCAVFGKCGRRQAGGDQARDQAKQPCPERMVYAAPRQEGLSRFTVVHFDVHGRVPDYVAILGSGFNVKQRKGCVKLSKSRRVRPLRGATSDHGWCPLVRPRTPGARARSMVWKGW